MNNDTFDSIDKKVDEIIEKSLDAIKRGLEPGPGSKMSGLEKAKLAGEGLKALAEGIESYHRAAKVLKDDSINAETSKKMMEKACDPSIKAIKI